MSIAPPIKPGEATWYAKNGNPWRQRRREKEAAGVVATVAMSPDYVVPGVERIAEIEGRCGVCRLTYWTLDEAKRAASVCDRCAK